MREPLEQANAVFHKTYDNACKGEERAGPVFIVLADDLIVFLPDGTRRALCITPESFPVLKAAAHVPVAIFAAMHQRDDRTLHQLRAHVLQSLAALSKHRAGSDDALAAIREALDESLAFLDAALAARSDESGPDVEAFAQASGARVLHLTALATRAQLDALHRVVQEAIKDLSTGLRERLEVVVTGNHQARARSLGVQYFCKRFGEAEGADERVTYAEGVDNEGDALALVGTRRMDAEIAKAFFGNAKRLQRDILGDAARDLLAHTELESLV